MHADEAVQAARFRDWWQTGNYVYDPNEYHGPTLIYATLPSVIGGGSDTFAETSAATYRAVPVFFGAGMVLLLWLLRDALGRAGLLWAAILVGCSPAGVFYSRYYIHETLLAFFTLAAIACGWRYVRSGRCRLVPGGRRRARPDASHQRDGRHRVSGGRCCLGGRRDTCAAKQATRPMPPWSWWHLALGATMAGLVAATLLSSFFTHPRGAIDGVLTYVPWLSRAGGQSAHIHPWYFYLHRLVWWRADEWAALFRGPDSGAGSCRIRGRISAQAALAERRTRRFCALVGLLHTAR